MRSDGAAPAHGICQFDRPSVGSRRKGFTFLELVIVLAIFGLVVAVIGIRTGSFASWKEEGMLRELSELIPFLHFQSISDQSFYQLEFDLKKNAYRVGILRPDSDVSASGAEDQFTDIGNLSRELNDFQNPSVGDSQTLIPPPSYPSLAEPKFFPADMIIAQVKTSREVVERQTGEYGRILFSPKGFSDFAVIHLRLSSGNQVTLFVNPYTGRADLYREWKDFEWKGRGGAR